MKILELKNMPQIKNSMNELNSRMEGIQERITNIVARTKERTHSNTERKQTAKNEERLRELWNYNKRSNICVIRVLETEEKKGGVEKIFEGIMA